MFNLFNSRHPQTFSNIFPTSSNSGGDMELLDVIYVKWSLPGTTSIFSHNSHGKIDFVSLKSILPS